VQERRHRYQVMHKTRAEQHRPTYQYDQQVRLIVHHAGRDIMYSELMDKYKEEGLSSGAAHVQTQVHLAWLECYCSTCQHCNLLEAPREPVDLVDRKPLMQAINLSVFEPSDGAGAGAGASNPQYNRHRAAGILMTDTFCLVAKALRDKRSYHSILEHRAWLARHEAEHAARQEEIKAARAEGIQMRKHKLQEEADARELELAEQEQKAMAEQKKRSKEERGVKRARAAEKE
jgi:hypothetical protein